MPLKQAQLQQGQAVYWRNTLTVSCDGAAVLYVQWEICWLCINMELHFFTDMTSVYVAEPWKDVWYLKEHEDRGLFWVLMLCCI